METVQKKHYSTFKISIRRSPYFMLKGDDATNHNIKIGSSIKGKSVLRGLDYEEEIQYLPNIIGVSSRDVSWNTATTAYWNDISVPIAADGATTEKLQGRIVEFVVAFDSATDKKAFEEVLDFEEKARIIKQKGTVIDGIDDYVLFRYCLVYSRVANRFEDVGKSPKIRFYLYSPKTEVLLEHKKFKERSNARKKFIEILDDEKLVNAMLLVFGQDLSMYETLEDKHLALEVFIEEQPDVFLAEVSNPDLSIKAFIKKAVEKQVIHNPSNTQSYYYGENNDILLGNTLEDTMIFLKGTDPKNEDVIKAIKARVNN